VARTGCQPGDLSQPMTVFTMGGQPSTSVDLWDALDPVPGRESVMTTVLDTAYLKVETSLHLPHHVADVAASTLIASSMIASTATPSIRLVFISADANASTAGQCSFSSEYVDSAKSFGS
jgi:hypothetical protein